MKASDEYWMLEALKLADKAADMGEVPVGAIVVMGDEVVGRGWNQPITSCDPSAHAEIMALRDAASSLNNYRLPEASLYVTLEPCSMCAGAMVHARIKRLIYAATEPKAGAVESQAHFFSADYLNHYPELSSGVLAKEASEKLSSFFAARRAEKKRLKEQALKP